MRRPVRPGPTLRSRIATWLAGGTLLLTAAALIAAFLAVRGALRADLQQALRRDALAVAAAYDGQAGAAVRPGPTGRVVVQIYGLDGSLIAASDPAFEAPDALLPASVLADAPADWRGRAEGRVVQAAAARFRAGTVVVIADAGYVGTALAAVARSLLWVGAVLAALAFPVAWLASRATTAPLRRLARAADRVDDDHLEPLGLVMPNDDVGRLAQVLDALLERLRDARDAQRRFLAETSHELRTPLTSLRGFLARARRSGGAAAQRDLADAERIAETMARLVEDLLELSRGRLVTQIEPHLVDLEHDLVRPVAAEFDGVEVEGDRTATLVGDPERLRRALRNLVANAVRAAGPEGRVIVRWRTAPDAVTLEVADDGPGLPDGFAPSLFEPFAAGPGGGTGLGLAIARQLVTMHGGRIEVRSVPGDTVFGVTIPTADEGDDEARDEDG